MGGGNFLVFREVELDILGTLMPTRPAKSQESHGLARVHCRQGSSAPQWTLGREHGQWLHGVPLLPGQAGGAEEAGIQPLPQRLPHIQTEAVSVTTAHFLFNSQSRTPRHPTF